METKLPTDPNITTGPQVSRASNVVELRPEAPAASNAETSDTATTDTDLSTTEASELVQQVREVTQNLQRSIEFSVSEELGRTIIKVYDTNTDQLIREIPAKELQRLAETIHKQLSEGLLLQEKA